MRGFQYGIRIKRAIKSDFACGSAPKSKIFVFGSWEHSQAFPKEKDYIGRMEKPSLTKKQAFGALPRQENHLGKPLEHSQELPNEK